jgi:hypothetical protein
MRFLANGPKIPDELLVARDEGRVIFFCGAGVSRARAGLSDFFGLAQMVIETLGVTADDPVRRIIEESQEIDRRTGVSGLISADRVFGLLERSFSSRDIEAAVAKALKPGLMPDLSAHRIMLDLARAPDGKVRLVTTNFDLLFESCDSSLPRSHPPQLPDPQRYKEFEGIIHLHGRVDEDYTGAVGGFVLSSSEFGRAYLSDGWATSFIKSVLDKYVVVFVGYTGDDPPVQYLLEALNRYSVSLEGVYAFQAGSQDEADAKWHHKGAKAISYDEADYHKTLWDTLAAWANRAKDPDRWYENIIDLSRKGPEALLPHERGQVVHIVSTLQGAHKFASSVDPPPAEWLCVFDPLIRYSKPGYLGGSSEEGAYFDPFEAYGMDSDPVPPKIDPNDYFAKRNVPDGIWDCFALTRIDLKDLKNDGFAALKGHWSVNVPGLPARLRHLSAWIAKVANQLAAVWWASGQKGIHPHLQDMIRFELGRTEKDCSSQIRKAWSYIFEAWEKQRNDVDLGWHRLRSAIDLDGWTQAAVRELARINQPFLTLERPWGRPRPPGNKDDIRMQDLVKVDVNYPAPDDDIQIPDKFLQVAVREFRKYLELAVYLENELGGYGLEFLSPIEPDPDLEGESSERKYGISASVLFYVNLLKRLIERDPRAAQQEYLAWWPEEETIFVRLRIWASGDRRILSGKQAGEAISNLSEHSFWHSRHQRDLLLALAKRWDDFPASVKRILEKRLLRGRSPLEGEEKAEYIKRRAWLMLNRIHWLRAQGCRFTFDLDAESDKLRELAPEWQPQYATKAAASMEGRGGSVQIEKEYSALLTEPLETLLNRAAELSGHIHGRLLVESDPFAGLASEKPVRAFSALVISAKRNDYPEWAWRTFLYSDGRKKDKPKFSALIAERLSRLSPSVLAEFLSPASDWLLSASKVLLSDYPGSFQRIWDRLILVLKSNIEAGKSSIVRINKEPDWATEALNSPVGKMAQLLMNDPVKNDLEIGKGFPAGWINRIEELLGLEGDLHRHALTMFAFNLNWFFGIDPFWTEKNLISILDREGDDQDAVLNGLLWNARVPDPKLFKRIKPYLLTIVRRNFSSRARYLKVLAGILLARWGSIDQETGKRFISNAEMREVLISSDDDFRVQILWQLKVWSSQGKEEGWKANLLVFLGEVWPRYKKAKGPKVSASLFDLAISDVENFPKVAEIILPLVTEINQEHIVLPNLRRGKSDIFFKFPERALALLFAVLPENASAWPYGMQAALDQIGAADPSMEKDARLVELKRRWNAR